MKWRSVDEKPKIEGMYYCFSLDLKTEEKRMGYSCFDETWNEPDCRYRVIAWLDPEVPDEFLKPKEPEKKPCPWCKCTNWIIDSDTFECHFWYDCKTEGCTSGPTMPTEAEAAAAIFERVR